MEVFYTIESWASNLGYIVEVNINQDEESFVWYKENTLKFSRAKTRQEVIEKILEEIKSSYEEGE